MKFWVKAKGESFEEQLLVTAENAEDLKRCLQELLHVSIRQMSVVDFQAQVVDKLNAGGSDILTVNLRTGPYSEVTSSGAATSGGSGRSAAYDSHSKSNPGESSMSSSSILEHSLRGFSVATAEVQQASLSRTSSGNALLHSSSRRGSGAGGGSINTPSATDLFNSDVLLPVERICLRREDLIALLSPALRGKFHSAVQGCFVRVRGAFSLGTTASGYATVQIVNVASETQLGLDLVHVVEVRHIDAVSNSPPTADEVRSWTKHMIHAGRPLVTSMFIEGKLIDVEDALKAARGLLLQPPPAPPAIPAPLDSSARLHQSSAPAAPTQESLSAVKSKEEPLAQPPAMTLDASPTPSTASLSKLRRRQTMLLQPNLFTAAEAQRLGQAAHIDSSDTGSVPGSVGVSPAKSDGATQQAARSDRHNTSSPSPSERDGTSPTNAPLRSHTQEPLQDDLEDAERSIVISSEAFTEGPNTQRYGSTRTSPAIRQRLDLIAAAMALQQQQGQQEHASPPPQTQSQTANAPNEAYMTPPRPGHHLISDHAAPPVVSTGNAHSIIRLNDSIENGWVVGHVCEDGSVEFSFFGTRHSNAKMKKPKRSDYAGFAVALRASGSYREHCSAPFTGGVDRDVTVKGFMVHGVPQLFRGVFVTLASPTPTGAADNCINESPVTSPERAHSAAPARSGREFAVGQDSAQEAPHFNGYEFTVLSGRDVMALYNPTWRCQLPVPSWGAALSSDNAALRPQLVYAREKLHVFYFVTMQRPVAAAKSQATSNEPGDDARAFGLAHAWTEDAKLSQWVLETVDSPIAATTRSCSVPHCPLFHVATKIHTTASPARKHPDALATEAVTLLVFEPFMPVAQSTTPAALTGVGTTSASRHRRRSPSQSEDGSRSLHSRSPVPTPPLEPHASTSGGSSAPESLVRVFVNIDDQLRAGSWTPHDARSVSTILSSDVVFGADQSRAPLLDEVKWNGGVKSVSLINSGDQTYVVVVGDDRHRRGTVFLVEVAVA